MRAEQEGAELEVLPLEGAAPPPRPPSRWQSVVAWADRHRRAVLAVAFVMAAAGGAHAALTVRGMRALERHVRSAVVLRAEYDDYVADLRRRSSPNYEILAPAPEEERIHRAARDYAARVAELGDRARRVLVLDPDGRRLRRAAVGRLRSEADAARRAAGDWFFTHEVAEAARQVQRGLRRRGLHDGEEPRPRPLAAVTALREAVPLLDEPTRTRLFAAMPDGVLDIDVDTGSARLVGRNDFAIGGWAPADGFAGTVVEGDGLIVPFGLGGPRRTVGRYDDALPDADDPTRVWFVSGPLDPGDPRRTVAHAFDRHGVRRDEVFPGEGGTVVAVSSRWVGRMTFDAREGTAFEVVDRRRGVPVAERRRAALLALRGDLLVWTDEARLLVRTLPGAEDRVVAAPAPGLVPGRALVSRNGQRLAVVWFRLGPGRVHEMRVVVHDLPSLRVVAVVWAGDDPVFPQPAWSQGSDWLFVLESRNVGRGRVLAWREGLAQPKRVLVEGQFYGLWAF